MAARSAADSGRICSADGAIIRIDDWYLGDIGWKTSYVIIFRARSSQHAPFVAIFAAQNWLIIERVTPDRNLGRYHWRRNGSDQGGTTDFWLRSFHATPIGLMFNYQIEGGTVPWCPLPRSAAYARYCPLILSEPEVWCLNVTSHSQIAPEEYPSHNLNLIRSKKRN